MKEIYAIGFAKKSLEQFVTLLKDAGVTRLVDIRLHNTSQLAGFAKKDDLEYIMKLVGIEYVHDLSLAPDEQLYDDYRKKRVSWSGLKERYLGLLGNRKVGRRVDGILGDGVPCFLCSEENPKQCHRSLLAEYIREIKNGEVRVRDLV